MSYFDTPVTVPDMKLFVAGKYAVGLCGDCRMVPTIKRWFDNDCDPDEATEKNWSDNFDILAMDSDGNLYTLFADTLQPLPLECFAVGSGMMVALGAMGAGASAVESVRVAALYDAHTCLPVQAITADDLKAILKTDVRRRRR